MSTTIEWTDETWNPVTGCTKVSPGCARCYIARTPAFRIAGRTFVDGHIPLRYHPERLVHPLHWKTPRRVFVNSLSDLFHEEVPQLVVDQVLDVALETPQHTYQILTKRPARMRAMVTSWYERFGERTLPNVWLGVSVETQRWTSRIPDLLQTRAAIRFVSYEPALGPVNFRQLTITDAGVELDALTGCHSGALTNLPLPPRLPGLDWIIIGGESGPGARPFHVAWAQQVLEQRGWLSTRVFVKQMGACPLVAAGRLRHYEWDTAKFEAWRGDPAYWRLRLGDAKGGNIAEWQPTLRVREYPA